jgi:hypothetical protein
MDEHIERILLELWPAILASVHTSQPLSEAFVWGDYAIGIDPNSLASMKAEGGRARPDIARLPGVRLAFANETRKGLQLDAGLIKALTGGDTVRARHLYQAEFDFKPTHKLWLRTNEEPQFDGGDTGMQRRVQKIPFTHEVKKSKAEDANLPEKLRAEAPGILNWAIRGSLSYQKHGLTEPAIVQRKPPNTSSHWTSWLSSSMRNARLVHSSRRLGTYISFTGNGSTSVARRPLAHHASKPTCSPKGSSGIPQRRGEFGMDSALGDSFEGW